ncbi:MAG TPA: methyltransferase domain-containing protein [Xanthomonadales bacterium]|nr:methyltransferase domain-containing protein [Xanthomonadales bacterium]
MDLRSHPDFWSEDIGARLLAAERAWLAEAPAATMGTTVWIAPAPRAGDPSAVAFSLDARGRLAGAAIAERDLLPLSDGSVRRLVLQHALEQPRIPSAFLGECVRVLAPGGELIVVGANPASPWAQWLRLAARRGQGRLRPRLPNRIRALLRAHGLSEFTQEARGPRWPGTVPDDAAHWGTPQRFGATYVLRGRKVTAMVIPLRPSAAPVGVPATGPVLVQRARPSLRACA